MEGVGEGGGGRESKAIADCKQQEASSHNKTTAHRGDTKKKPRLSSKRLVNDSPIHGDAGESLKLKRSCTTADAADGSTCQRVLRY